MSTMTTIQRATPALSIAPTQNQNTAPVYEFECLFTHDLRKKKKTWHDGSLRFHTFNRRVMVYDDSKNFIGDLHYRDADELQEGEELRLDKGVLVDVGRRIGQTDTDLTEVLDRGRHGEDGAAARHANSVATNQNMQRLASGHTQGRPKSLAAVLGASQGPIGRARLAFKSPYEQLHVARAAPSLEEPSAKRRRIAMDKENVPTASIAVGLEHQDENQLPPSVTPVRPRAPLTVRKETNTSIAVIDISSEDESVKSPAFSSAFGNTRLRQKGTKAVRNPPAKLDLAPKPFKQKQSLPSKPAKPVETAKISSRVQEKQKPSHNADPTSEVEVVLTKAQGKRKSGATAKPPVEIERTSSTAQCKPGTSIRLGLSTRSTQLSSGPTSKLRFAPKKLRPKLMYKDLLPSSFTASQPRSPKSAEAMSLSKSSRIDTDQGSATSPAQESLTQSRPERDVFDFPSIERVQSKQQRGQSLVESPVRPGANSLVYQASSSLFVSQSPSNVMPAAPNIDDDSPVPSPVKTPVLNTRVEIRLPGEQMILEDSPITADKIIEPPSSVSKLTLMDQRLMMMPPPQSAQATPSSPKAPKSPHPRPFRRVLSENDSPAQTNARLTVSPPLAKIPSALDGMQQRSKGRVSEVRRPFKSPTTLQRSHSDTSATLQVEMRRPTGRTCANVPEIIQEEGDGDTGPWSSREAFLLFDWWPPGHQKPDYARGADGFVRPRNVFQHTSTAVTGFRSAGVIRDGVDI